MTNNRERLIDIVRDIFHTDFSGTDEEGYADFADRLLANGVIVPPVQIGGKVYEIRANGKGSPRGRYCDYSITTNHSFRNAIERGLKLYIKQKDFVKTDMTRWNKTVFLTKEEAEAKLKEREGK